MGQDTKPIAITIDDLPVLTHGLIDVDDQQKYFHRILATLRKHNVIATGFVVGKMVNSQNEDLIKAFIKEGHFIGNHTFSHFDLNKKSATEFIDDIKKGQSEIKKFQKKVKFFRYPMLHRGDEIKKRDSVSTYLITNNYIASPVSIDNDETIFNINFVKAYYQNKKEEADSIGQAYISHMINKSLYYDSLGYDVTGRQINHILLLHMNFINSFYLDTLLTWYKNNNWEFITLDEALSDPLYFWEDPYVGKRGISWVERY